MGFEDECFRETVDSMIDRALDSPNPWLQGITRERLESEHRIRLNLRREKWRRNGRFAEHSTPARPS